MVNKAIEFFILEDYSNIYVPHTEIEYFDTYEDALSHVNDKDENGNLKYTTCMITRKGITPTLQRMEIFERWIFENGKFVSHNICREN